MQGLYCYLGFDYSLNYLAGPQVFFVQLFLWSIRHGSSLSCSADYLFGEFRGIQMFFAGMNPSTMQAFHRAGVGLSACLSERHAPPPGCSHELSFQVAQHRLSNWPKSKNVPLAALVELCSSTLVLILPPTWCNTQDVAPWLATVRQNREFII